MDALTYTKVYLCIVTVGRGWLTAITVGIQYVRLKYSRPTNFRSVLHYTSIYRCFGRSLTSRVLLFTPSAVFSSLSIATVNKNIIALFQLLFFIAFAEPILFYAAVCPLSFVSSIYDFLWGVLLPAVSYIHMYYVCEFLKHNLKNIFWGLSVYI